MDLKLIEDAIVLLEEGSMSAAAARRNVTQPAFSRRIRALEDWLGEELVERRANSIRITEAFTRRESEFRALFQSINAFRTNAHKSRLSLVVGAPHALSIAVFPEIYARIQKLDQVDHVRVRTRNSNEAMAEFLRFEIDILLSYQAAPQAALPFDATVLQGIWRRDTMVPVVGGELRYILDENQIPTGQLPLIRYPDDSEFGRLIHNADRAESLAQGSEIIATTAFTPTIAQMVRLGLGAAWLPHSLIRDELRKGEIVPLSPGFGRIPLNVVLSANKSNRIGASILTQIIHQDAWIQ